MLKPVYEDSRVFDCKDLYLHSTSAPAGNEIWSVCHQMAQLLIEKNISYGNSALEPVNIFSDQNHMDGLKARVDDKLSRIKNNQGYVGDNDLDDLIGYLILLKIALDKDGLKGV